VSIVPQANPTVAEPPLYSATELVEKKAQYSAIHPLFSALHGTQLASANCVVAPRAVWLAAHTVKD
jgi:hypothetical protein